MRRGVSRREFIKYSAVGAAIPFLPGLLSSCGGGGGDGGVEGGGGGKIYGYTFALRGDGKVVVIDEDTEQIVAQINLPENGGTLGTLTRDGRRLYVANNAGRTVSIIDARNFTKIKDLVTGTRPKHPIVSPDQRIVAVNHSGLDGGRSRVVFIDVATDEVINIVGLPIVNTGHSGDFTMHGSWSADGQIYMVGNYADNKAYVIDRQGNIRAEIPLAGNPHYFDWFGREVWITVEKDETVADGRPQVVIYDVYDPDDPQLVDIINMNLVGGESGGAVEGHHGNFTNDGRYFYVCNRGSGPNFEGVSINVIDRATRQIVATIQSPARGAGHVYFDMTGRRAIVTNYGDKKIPILDVSNPENPTVLRVLDPEGSGGHMGHVTFTRDSKKAFVSDRRGDRVIVIDMENLTIKRYIPTGSGQRQGQVVNRYYNVFERVINPNLLDLLLTRLKYLLRI